MKKYSTNRRWVLLIFASMIFIVIGMASGNPQAFMTSITPWAIIIFLVLVFLDIYAGMYISIKENELIRTDHFFLHKVVSIPDIKDIWYKPTWILGGGLGYSLFVRGFRDNKKIIIEITNVGFTLATLSNIVNDLIKINPAIQLDEETKKLISNA